MNKIYNRCCYFDIGMNRCETEAAVEIWNKDSNADRYDYTCSCERHIFDLLYEFSEVVFLEKSLLKEKLEALKKEKSALLGQMGMVKELHICEGGWVCESHPWLGWPHDDCAGPGMPCKFRKDESSGEGTAHKNINKCNCEDCYCKNNE